MAYTAKNLDHDAIRAADAARMVPIRKATIGQLTQAYTSFSGRKPASKSAILAYFDRNGVVNLVNAGPNGFMALVG